MSGSQVKAVRGRLGWTQQQASRRWKVSQAYLSLVEHNKRPVPARLARLLAHEEPSMATGLPVELPVKAAKDLPRLLGGVGYPGFAYLANRGDVANPAAVVLAALQAREVPARVVEALPWVLLTFTNLDWNWLVDSVKLANVQNRLGYLVGLAGDLALGRGELAAVNRLSEVGEKLEEARLAKEDTLGRELTDAERRHVRAHRPAAAAHWNLLTNLRAEHLRHGR